MQLERQKNLQMPGDKKKKKKGYQKTLQELEKDLYDANPQHLSYKVMYSLYIHTLMV